MPDYDPVVQEGEDSPSWTRFQVLALDGGGAKGLFTAHLLACLEADLNMKVRDTFDLIVGTSTGGIIALALGAGLDPHEIVEHYKALTMAVFPPSRRRGLGRLRGWRSTTYDASALQTALKDILGDRLLGDSDKRLVVPSYDLQAGGVHLFKTPHHKRLTRDWKVPMVDVGIATAAAPTFLPAHQMAGHRLVDGGVWANNASVVGIAEAVSMLDVPLSAIRLLNVGTLEATTEHSDKLDRGGKVPWGLCGGLDVFMRANAKGAQGLATHMISPDRFSRFDAIVPSGIYALDEADPTKLQGLASARARELSPVFTERFAGHVAAPYDPAFDLPTTGAGAVPRPDSASTHE